MRRKFAPVEIAGGSLVQVEEIVVIEPFEIEQLKNGFAHANVGKNRPTRVEDQSLHALWKPIGQIFFDHVAFAHGGKIVSHLPTAGVGLDTQIVQPFLERFEMRIPVAVIVETNGVEIPKPSIDRQYSTPIDLVAHEGYALH